ncbi:hypothetical protein AB0D10_04160 [Kitasatospora sp. NPDC048545]|uniref:hypothetical protein n=1 Tax=Kitasatospora sp. NPDC048545 TaxID=3157208 RepID=UPI0033C9BBEB
MPSPSGATDHQGFVDFLTNAYDSACHSVLRGLSAVGVVLSVVITALLCDRRQ